MCSGGQAHEAPGGNVEEKTRDPLFRYLRERLSGWLKAPCMEKGTLHETKTLFAAA